MQVRNTNATNKHNKTYSVAQQKNTDNRNDTYDIQKMKNRQRSLYDE